MNKSGVKNVGHACCVAGCANRRNANPELQFYAFPNRPWEAERKKKWIISVRRKE